MTFLARKALWGLVRLQIFLAVWLFVPAWSLRFWEAWVYWVLFGLSMFGITLYLLKHDPGLVERRMKAGPKAEKEKSQKVIMAAAVVLMFAVYLMPGFDFRYHWSVVPTFLVWIANGVTVAGWVSILRVFRENSFAASTIRVEAEQRVISTGPYALVRHPMYFGAVVSFLATPFALGSVWALIPAVLLCGVLAVRLLYEESFLLKSLPGYEAYCQKVRWHLIPYIW